VNDLRNRLDSKYIYYSRLYILDGLLIKVKALYFFLSYLFLIFLYFDMVSEN